MPLNKNSFLRYHVIDACLNNKFRPFPSIDLLMEKCSEKLGLPVSKSTIEKDIHAMKFQEPPGFDAPIGFDRNRGGYYYETPGYTINKINVKEEDIDAIEFAAKVLRQYSGFHIVKRYAEAIDRILDVVDVRRILSKEELEEYVQFETPPYIEGTRHIEPIIRAIREKQVLKIEYQAFYKDNPDIRIIHPYLLKEYRNRWYLVGLDDEKNKIRTFGLDRIVSTETMLDAGSLILDKKGEHSTQTIQDPASSIQHPVSFRQVKFNARDYFRNTIGIIAPQSKPPIIKLAFSKFQAQYLITQPIHESQKILKETKDKVIFSFEVHPTYEFISLLLGYRDEVRVLSPIWLKESIKDLLMKMMKSYG
jgi:predicted DNA-binding transcriptional regulator YafY